MAYKSAYTIEEAALIAAWIYEYSDGIGGFYEYRTLEKAKIRVGQIEDELPNISPEDIVEKYGSRERFACYKESSYGFIAKYHNALDIVDGINRAIAIGQLEAYKSGDLQLIDQKSIAAWFMDQGETGIAMQFFPSILSVWEPSASKPANPLKPKDEDIATKTKNAYLKTISALSMALISGSCGKPHTDAEAVLSILDKAGIEHPVSKRKLAEYLKETGDY